MDNLLNHCLRELGFDGDLGKLLHCFSETSPRAGPSFDPFFGHLLVNLITVFLGCSPSRLGEFVHNFYSHQTSSHAQNIDEKFLSFVWSLVVAHPDVRIGTIPPGLTSEVYVAPQTSAARKAKAKGEEYVETVAPELGVIEGAKSRALPDLNQEYGETLRVALTPDAVFTAITGSHIRVCSSAALLG
jgi:transcription factor C subunit 3